MYDKLLKPRQSFRVTLFIALSGILQVDELQKSKNPKNESYILDAEMVRQGPMNIW